MANSCICKPRRKNKGGGTLSSPPTNTTFSSTCKYTIYNRSYDYVVRLLARSLFTILERIIVVFGNIHLPTNGRRPASNSGFIADNSKRKKKQQQSLNPPGSCGKRLHSESKQLGHIGAFKGCMSAANSSPVIQSCMQTNGGSMRLTDCHVKYIDKVKTVDTLSLSNRIRIYSKLASHDRLKPASFTLGDAALALHYANVIVLIERMVSSPHLIDIETRDNLYNMLPNSIRAVLRAKLKWYAKSKASWVYDANLAAEWSEACVQILEWLAPLAHNMIRWHSERNFEKEHSTFNANILLVHTLYYANQAKTEAAMIELLVGLNYVCRSDRKVGIRDTLEFTGTRSLIGVSLRKNGMCNEFL